MRIESLHAPSDTPLPSVEILSHLHDSHAHPTTSTENLFDELKKHRLGSITAMSTNDEDQDLIKQLAKEGGSKIIPCFGFHPWFTYRISLLSTPPSNEAHYSSLFLTPSSPPSDHQLVQDLLPFLPDPIPLPSLLHTLRENLLSHPTSLLGEVGLDKRARVPFPPSYIASLPPDLALEHRKFTNWSTNMDHQVAILTAQMEVLEEIICESNEPDEGDGIVRNGKARRVSIHAVGCAGLLGGLLDAWEREIWDGRRRWRKEVKVCVHSCGLSSEAWAQIEKKHPTNLYLSASPIVLHEPGPSNSPQPHHMSSGPTNLPTLPPLFTSTCSADKVLVESDSPDLRCSEEGVWKVVRALARGRGWKLEESWPTASELEVEGREKGVIERLEDNWLRWMGDDT